MTTNIPPMKKLLLLTLFLCLFHGGYSQTGIGTVTPQDGTILDLTSPNKALLLSRVDNTGLITTPANGMVVFDKSSQCIKIYQSGAWSDCIYSLPGTISNINCAGIPNSGALKEGVAAQNVVSVIAYSGGNGGIHTGQSVASTGVTGLTATASASNFVTGDGTLLYNITGTPIGSGVASFAINIGGKNCSIVRNVLPAFSLVSAINCAGATNSGVLVKSTTASSVSSQLPYTGGNGGEYPSQTFSSTGVTGLTATLAAGTLLTGNGTVTLTITGTPATDGTANFAIMLGGQSCTLSLTVNPLAGNIATLNCGSPTNTGTLQQGSTASGVSSTIAYTGGNTGNYASQSIASTGATGLTATLAAGSFTSGSGQLAFTIAGTPVTSGTATFAFTIGGQSCSLALTVAAITPAAIPSTITLAQSQRYFIGSMYDTDYLPYSTPAAVATTATTPANGVADPTLDVPGIITTTGITVQLPATATGTGTLPAYTTGQVTIPAELTEDGISRTVTLSWAAQAYTTATKTITATIKAIGGSLNVKKLDINSGVGNDAMGVLLTNLYYPYNNANAVTTYSVRAISGIPDRMFGIADNTGSVETHKFLYLPVMGEDGKVWLNNNLGADYTNINKPTVFNLGQQATSATDFRAYGSLFQWGRKADGHELINFTSGTAGAAVNGTTSTKSDVPNNALFVTATGPGDWRVNPNSTLWSGETAVNNPCPYGFRLPVDTEYTAYITSTAMSNPPTAAATKLKLTAASERSSSGVLSGTGTFLFNYTATSLATSTGRALVVYGSANLTSANAVEAMSVRCIKN